MQSNKAALRQFSKTDQTMWTCKKCGKAGINDEWQECWNCGTRRDWVPPSDWVTPSDTSANHIEHKTAPLSSGVARALSALGMAVGIVGVIAGCIILSNSPEAPSAYRTDVLTEIAQANRMTYLVLGWSQIVGGLVMGLLLFVVGGIGQVVVELWNDRNAGAGKELNPESVTDLTERGVPLNDKIR